MLIEKVLYNAHVRATGGRDSRAVSSDGALDLTITTPRELGGAHTCGPNSEQLFAAGYAACFLGAIKSAAARNGVVLPADTEVEATVAVGPVDEGFGLEVELRITLPGIPRAEADSLVERAHRMCAYSNATRGNIPVRLVLA
jgi:lipoyl-dependent peroxiredoxin